MTGIKTEVSSNRPGQKKKQKTLLQKEALRLSSCEGPAVKGGEQQHACFFPAQLPIVWGIFSWLQCAPEYLSSYLSLKSDIWVCNIQVLLVCGFCIAL